MNILKDIFFIKFLIYLLIIIHRQISI